MRIFTKYNISIIYHCAKQAIHNVVLEKVRLEKYACLQDIPLA